jgi:PAS domain S-box-containing protein
MMEAPLQANAFGAVESRRFLLPATIGLGSNRDSKAFLGQPDRAWARGRGFEADRHLREWPKTARSEIENIVPSADSSAAADSAEFLFSWQLLDVCPLAMAIVGPDLRVRQANQAMRDLNSLTSEQVAGKTLPELLPQVEPRAWRLIRRVLATGEPAHETEITSTTRASGPGRRVWSVSHYPVRNRGGEIVAVGLIIVDVTEQRRTEVERDDVGRRLRLLSRASALVGGSLDLAATLEGVAELLVPEFADIASLYLLDEALDADSRPDTLMLRRATIAHGDDDWSSSPVASDSAVGSLYAFNRETAMYRALITRWPVRFAFEDHAVRNLGIPEAADYFRRLGLRSGIAVPLLAGRSFHGGLFACFGDSGREYTEQDLQTAADVGSRVASAIANARAYASQREVSVALQRSLLPPATPVVEDIEIVSRYEPSGAGDASALPADRPIVGQPHGRGRPGPAARTEAGGDWFDVIPLSAGRFAFVIGDVMGRGVTAAAAMGQVSTAARAFAALDLPADDVLTYLDSLVQAMSTGPDGALVSCVYAIFEPASATITLANAGHLPPALRDPDGQVRFLENPGSALLGLGGQRFAETHHQFPPGATLALYTDGLVESPGVDINEGMQRLRRALTPPDTAHSTADRLMGLIDHAGGYDDDATLLLVQAAAATHGDTLKADLASDPGIVGQIRETVSAVLRDWDLAECIDTAELLVSEIVTNAIRYARAPGALVVRRAADAIYIEVSDSDGQVPRILHPSDEEEHGRGMILVEALAAQWGTRPTHTGKTVWCQLAAVRNTQASRRDHLRHQA